jgi:Na+-driven multidrug efflux pump
LTKWFSVIGIIMGMGVMTIMGAIMYFFAPEMMSLITNESGIISLGADVLKIEAFAEPMFAASIVSYGILVGSGNTMISSATNFCSIWLVRITLAFLLAPSLGLMGVWIAMAIELCFRGIVFLIIIFRWKWLHKVL